VKSLYNKLIGRAPEVGPLKIIHSLRSEHCEYIPFNSLHPKSMLPDVYVLLLYILRQGFRTRTVWLGHKDPRRNSSSRSNKRIPKIRRVPTRARPRYINTPHHIGTALKQSALVLMINRIADYAINRSWVEAPSSQRRLSNKKNVARTCQILVFTHADMDSS
jgi:hypothetical protein